MGGCIIIYVSFYLIAWVTTKVIKSKCARTLFEQRGRCIMTFSKQGTTIAKGLFMLMILVNHCVIEVPFSTIKPYTHNICHIGMAGFLFLSGYGLVCSFYENGLTNYWNNKFHKIYLPAVIINILEVILQLTIYHQEFNCSTWFKEVFLLSDGQTIINGYLVFLHLLLVFYVLFYILTSYISDTKLRIAAWCLIALGMWYIIPQNYGLANTYCMAFPVGVIYSEWMKDRHDFKGGFIYCLRMVGAVITFVGMYIVIKYTNEHELIFFGREINFYTFTLIDNIIFICGAWTVCWLSDLLTKLLVKKIFINMGEISLWIYYLQEPLIIYPMRCADTLGTRIVIMCVGNLVTFAAAFILQKAMSNMWARKLS